MDPKQQECLSLYLYGAGYYGRDDNTLGIISGKGSAEPHFCLGCPKRGECETQHEKRVRRLMPQEAEDFDRTMQEALSRGVPPTLAAAYIGKNGADPFLNMAIDNYGRGHADRGKKDGVLVQ